MGRDSKAASRARQPGPGARWRFQAGSAKTVERRSTRPRSGARASHAPADDRPAHHLDAHRPAGDRQLADRAMVRLGPFIFAYVTAEADHRNSTPGCIIVSLQIADGLMASSC